MKFNPTSDEVTKFYNLLQTKLPDHRSSIGRKHELAFVIVLFTVAILRSTSKLSLNNIHVTMELLYHDLCITIKKDAQKCISRTQLSRILQDLDHDSFNSIADNYWGCTFHKDNWISIDGKELRGTIDGVLGNKRGLSIVLSADHKTRQQKVYGFYSGLKESEKNVIEEIIDTLPEGSKISVDALHNSEPLLSKMESKTITYLTQIKSNQKVLLQDIKHISNYIIPIKEEIHLEKGHGRVDERTYRIFNANVECFDKRWKNSGIRYIIEVKRKHFHCKKQQETVKTSYYISNSKKDPLELINVIRKHWTVEVMNNIRDVNFGEDQLRSLNEELQKSTSSILTFITNGLNRMEPESNMKTLRTKMALSSEYVNQFFAS